ncbi:MAG: hypothetical protein IJ741_03745 [Schwartzia sp.]|nr:hypothetical protein [Schwartzia sp. (in: firmicutes)]
MPTNFTDDQLAKATRLKHLKSLAARTKAVTDALDSRTSALEAVGAQANVLESVSVNGMPQTISEKNVDITMPTKVSDLTNDSDFQSGTQVQNAIAAKISSAYKAGGTKAFADLPALLVAANEGYVYNVSDAFTTTADFVEGAGKKHPAGTNVVVINTADEGETAVYKFDVLAGFVDLSNLVEKEAGKGLSTEDYTTTEKDKLAAISQQANKTTVTTEKAGTIEIDGTSKVIVEFATDEEVASMIDDELPAPAGA